MFGIFGTLVAVEGAQRELVECLLRAAELLADDASCIQYAVGPSGDRDVSVFELWTDEAAHGASLERADVQALIAQGRPLISGFAGQTRMRVVGGKGVGHPG